jgi:predicted ester cyclase
MQRLATMRSAFPDAALTVEDVVAAGDRVAFRSTLRGTHRGEFMGIPPTGRQFTIGLVDIIRIEDGKFVEQWGGPDMLGLLQQLGATVSAGG